MRGTLYGVGVGPGDPELMTVKGARILRECAVVAVPDSGTGERVALEIAREYIQGKPVVYCPMPMTRDRTELARRRGESADLLCGHLAAGKDVAFLTLGDPTIYSTYLYLHRLVEERGYRAEMVAGVPSFCAAAAALGVPLCEAGQALHIIPASYQGSADALDLDGVKVLMKSGRQMGELLDRLKSRNMLQNAVMAERVGLADQRLVRDLNDLDAPPGYLSLIILTEDGDADE